MTPLKLPSGANIRRLPHYPVPAVRVGRVVAATSAYGQGYGQWLLGHAVNVSLRLRRQLGVRVLLVDALDAEVAGFCHAFGFRPNATQALTLYLPLGPEA